VLGLDINITTFTNFLYITSGIVTLDDNYTFAFDTESAKWNLTTEKPENSGVNNTKYSVGELAAAGITYTYGGTIEDGI